MLRVTHTSFKLNNASVLRKLRLAEGRAPSVRRAAYNKAYGMFYYAKTRMIDEFDDSLITQEIQAGPRAENISDTLGGYGNLYSFIGFTAGGDPTEKLRLILQMGTTFNTLGYQTGAWNFRYSLPDRKTLEAASPMPSRWDQGSWAYKVESYISGLSHYMYKKEGFRTSFSGTGLEMPFERLEDAVFTGKPYITQILNNFRIRVSKSGRRFHAKYS